MGKRDKGNSENFILKLPLKTELWQEHILNKRFEICRKIYNSFQNKMIKRFAYISQMNDFKKCKTKKEKVISLRIFIVKIVVKVAYFQNMGLNRKFLFLNILETVV